MRLNALALLGGLAVLTLAALLWFSGGFTALSSYAQAVQREAQTAMAGSLQALRMGDKSAFLVLTALSAGYGFAHAVGPGHGKVLLGGAAFAGRVSLRRMLGLSVASALAQALSAIVLVYGGLALLTASARPLTALAEQWLAPTSYALIAGLGLFMIWRGLRLFAARPGYSGIGSCTHAHGPCAAQIAGLTGWRDALALIGSIAIRPCSGAIILLFIAWQLDLALAGLAGAVAMGLGTAAFNALVTGGAVLTRESLVLGAGSAPWLMPGLQIAAGFLLALTASALLFGTMTL
ncbi:MAG: hypothetical protein AAGC92_02595 [Pseudomonadota bacterium]